MSEFLTKFYVQG